MYGMLLQTRVMRPGPSRNAHSSPSSWYVNFGINPFDHALTNFNAYFVTPANSATTSKLMCNMKDIIIEWI